jgi:hypothetical protein
MHGLDKRAEASHGVVVPYRRGESMKCFSLVLVAFLSRPSVTFARQVAATHAPSPRAAKAEKAEPYVWFNVVDRNGNPIPATASYFAAHFVRKDADARGYLEVPCRSWGATLNYPGFATLDLIKPREAACNTPGASHAMDNVVLDPLPMGVQSAPYPKQALALARESDHMLLVYSLEQVRAMEHVTVTVHNAHANADQTYSGVPLAALLAKLNAPLGDQLNGKAITTGVVARGTDGYAVLLSLAEIDPAFHSGDVIVADTLDGKPIEKNGPFQLVVSEDKRPARWVRNLVSISLVEIH